MDNAVVASPPKLSRRTRAASWPAAFLAVGLASAGVLYAVNPADHALYPTCWLYATTGLLCPGCRGLRATHQLLHGNLTIAWALNPLAVLLVPLYAWFGVHAVLCIVRGHGLPSLLPRSAIVWLGLASVLLFAIVRNLLLH